VFVSLYVFVFKICLVLDRAAQFTSESQHELEEDVGHAIESIWCASAVPLTPHIEGRVRRRIEGVIEVVLRDRGRHGTRSVTGIIVVGSGIGQQKTGRQEGR